ncbi:hypothetical protein PIB30_064233 [Stylosanthes scabra]|uniref:Uncharacterized protein n=1 Tax=Stylosanthes scabra TaxID=79078 RepID=A0ABU6RM90_9FABA|nr:hypothetical protein [Stylosanthes scabra]
MGQVFLAYKVAYTTTHIDSQLHMYHDFVTVTKSKGTGEVPVNGASTNGEYPRSSMDNSAGIRSIIASRCNAKNVVRNCMESPYGHPIAEYISFGYTLSPTNREIDDINTVVDGLVNCPQYIAVVATVLVCS